MKYVFYLLNLFLIVLYCNTVYAAVTDEEFEALSRQVKSMEKTIGRLEKYLDKAERIKQEAARPSIASETTQIQEYVCRKGHVFSAKSESGKCPTCGLKQKERSRFKKSKLARRESISDAISADDEEFDKAERIEQEMARSSRKSESTQIQDISSNDKNDIAKAEERFEKKISTLQDMVYELKDRANFMDMTEEIRQIQEYVCRKGHVFSAKSENGKCPTCGLKQKERSRFKKFKFARRESISDGISAAVEEEFAKRVTIGVIGTGIFQQLIHSDTQGRSSGKKSFAAGSTDILFIAKPLLYTTFFLDLEAIGGDGPDVSVGSFSGLNDDAGSLQADDGVDRVAVREAWLQTFLLQERLRIVSGKIDLTNYFDSNTVANDETTQFITSAFVNNRTMEQPDNGPGLVAFFDTRKAFTFGLGLQSIDDSGENITDDIYVIAEIGYRSHFFFNQEGNYRLWGKIKGGTEDNNGFGVSIDQNLSTRLTAFGRYGANESDGASVESAWSAGFRFRSPFFSRVNDEVGFAFGMLDIVDRDKESATEVYYKFQVNDRFAVSPNFQAVFDPGGMGSNDTAAVIGFRTQIQF